MESNRQFIIKELTTKDFKEEEAEKFVYRRGDWEITFREEYGTFAKRIVEVWYREGRKKYLKDRKVIDWKFTLDKYVIRQRNDLFRRTINKFNKMYLV